MRQWQQKQARLDAINKEYENLRSVRKDAVYHHGWAQSRGDWKEAEDHEAHVVEIDKKLGILKEQYQAVEDGRLQDFAGVVISDRLGGHDRAERTRHWSRGPSKQVAESWSSGP